MVARGREPWKEVLQEVEAHIVGCSATDDNDVVLRNSTQNFGVSCYATQKRLGEFLGAGYT
jgi:hypothetical protein